MAGPSLEGLLNPDLLTWAREACALDIEGAAHRIGVKPEKLADWEAGRATPTLRQLREIAKVYRRSISVFFLRERPRRLRFPTDYRRLELSAANVMSPTLATAIREAYAKREAALDIFAQLEEEPPKFNLRLAPHTPYTDAARILTDALGLAVKQRAHWRTDYDALNAWRTAIEAQGVLVMQASDIDTQEMRGVSISLRPLPIIILNSADRPLGRVFTLLHELTHLARSESILCDFRDDQPMARDARQVEIYCNHVAGAVLVPREDLLRLPKVARATRNSRWIDTDLDEMRSVFWASREVILRRLQIIGRTSEEFYAQRRLQFIQEYERLRESSSGFAHWHRRVIARNGRLLTRLVLDAYNANAITGSEVSRVLGTKLDHLPKIMEAMTERDAA